ncbi:hypothetical protein [Gorillibacterium sp. CAU 1737]|uniref:hypothetical protein n=1 Tax=Gorillibacterium sp. CAU 1737 TaxID=3140362 RepID=UPI003260EC7B
MSNEKPRDLQEDLRNLALIPRDPDDPVDMVHDVVTPHALRRAIAAEAAISEALSIWETMQPEDDPQTTAECVIERLREARVHEQ